MNEAYTEVELAQPVAPEFDDALPRPLARQVLDEGARRVMQRLRRRQG
jgi:hypothetical protein